MLTFAGTTKKESKAHLATLARLNTVKVWDFLREKVQDFVRIPPGQIWVQINSRRP
jgi:hypothetical protein